MTERPTTQELTAANAPETIATPYLARPTDATPEGMQFERVATPPSHDALGSVDSSALALVLDAADLYYFDWTDIGRPELYADDKLRAFLQVDAAQAFVTWTDITAKIHAEERPNFERQLLKAFATLGRIREDVYLETSGGTYRRAEVTAKVAGGSGAPLRLTGAIRLRDADHDLVVENAKVARRLALVVEATRVGVWDWMDMTTEDVEFSSGLINMLGYDDSRFTMTLDRFWDLIHRDDLENVRQAVTASKQNDSPFDTQYRIQFANRGYRWVRSMGTISTNVNGTQRLTGAISDIHDQIVMKERVRKVIEQQQLAATAASSGIWDWRDVDAEAIYMSSGMLDLLGYREHEVSQTLDGWWELVHVDDRPGAAAALEVSLRGGRPFRAEYRMLFASGVYQWVRSTGVPVKNDEGAVTRLTGSITSIASEVDTRTRLQDQAKLYEREFEKLSDRLLRSLSEIEVSCGMESPAGSTHAPDGAAFDSVLTDVAHHAREALADIREARRKMNIAK